MQKFFIETYGCQMNVYDSQLVAGILHQAGYEEAETIEDADIILINTCSVREKAEQRVIARSLQLGAWKKDDPDLILGIMGCMAQRLGKSLLAEHDHLDLVVGTDAYNFLPQLLERVTLKRGSIALTEVNSNMTYENIVPYTKRGASAFVTIMRGCNNFCSYCIVPYVRGRERSRNLEDILEDVKRIAETGIKEVVFLGQNVNSYKSANFDFADLLQRTNKIPGIERIRFTTSHPKDLSKRLIKSMSDCDKVCEHFHLAMQSGSNRILEKMNRNYTKEHYLKLIEKLRKYMPEIAISTDIIVGFPSETEEDFQKTLDIVRKIRFDFAFMFRYSVRSGTKAAEMEDDVPEEVKLRRLRELIDLQHQIALKEVQKNVGKLEKILVEKVSLRDESQVMGRTRTFKTVVFEGDKSLIGEIVTVKIVKAKGLTLIGKRVGE